MLRLKRGGIAQLSQAIERDLGFRLACLDKTLLKGLCDIVASVLHTRSVNTSELASVLPRACANDENRYRVINRFLANTRISTTSIMSDLLPELLEGACCSGKSAVLMMDQSKISDGFECLMVSLRLGARAVPVLWRVIETKGEIGFDIQKQLLDDLTALIPDGCRILLSADRFYGHCRLIDYCQNRGWQYRIRLKGNLTLCHEGGELMSGEIGQLGMQGLEEAELYGSGVKTNIGYLREDGHNEAWIVAMDCRPTPARVADYEMRWGIECLFSDFKSRGFGITRTKLRHAERIERLILVVSIALYFAVSTAMQPQDREPMYTPKKLFAA